MKLINNLKKNTFSIGPFPKSSYPSIIECMGLTGFDFLVIDLEHGPNTIETAQNLVRAASLHEMTPIIQVSENNEYLISSVLDIGAQGVQVPQIDSKEDAIKVVEAAKFAPLGMHGVCRYIRSAGFSSMYKSVYFKESNEITLVILQIGSKTGIENLDGILEVDVGIFFDACSSINRACRKTLK